MNKSDYDISIVIACYNGAHFLESGVDKIVDILSKTKYNYEFVFVDDCSKDNTKDIIEKLLTKYPNSQAIYHKINMGRGKTVEDGMRVSRGKITGFIDVDLETPGYYIPALLNEFKKGYDICTARRFYILNYVKFHSLHRWIAHKSYKFLVRLLLKTPINDTETGCKFFIKDKIMPLFEEIKDKYWFWDTEVMIRSYYKGLKIREVPTIFIREDNKGTSVKFFRDVTRYLKNLLQFRKEVRKLRKEALNL